MSEWVQILVVELNGRHNAYEGERNIVRRAGCVKEEESRELIKKLLDNLTKRGYVLAKWKGQLFLCEKNNENKERGYDRTFITYHPLQEEFI